MDPLLPFLNFSMDECISMDEYISRKSLELNRMENRKAAMQIFYEDTISRCFRISVEGYDTSLPADYIEVELIKRFGLCGKVCDVEIPRDPVTNLIKRCASVYLLGEGAEERALALNGSDLGGWNAVIRSLPKKECTIDPDQVAALRAAYDRKNLNRRVGISVEGYDTSLPADDIKRALIRHFYSCGEITHLSISEGPPPTTTSRALVYFYGEGAAEKALALSGSYMGERRVFAKALPEPNRDNTPDPLGLYYGSTVPVRSSKKTAE